MREVTKSHLPLLVLSDDTAMYREEISQLGEMSAMLTNCVIDAPR